MGIIDWSDFEKIDIRVGKIIEVIDFKEAKKPAWQLKIDFGNDIGIKKSSAQIKVLYNESDLLNKQIIAIVNFPPKQIGKFMSECLVLGVYDEQGIVLLKPEREVALGTKIG